MAKTKGNIDLHPRLIELLGKLLACLRCILSNQLSIGSSKLQATLYLNTLVILKINVQKTKTSEPSFMNPRQILRIILNFL